MEDKKIKFVDRNYLKQLAKRIETKNLKNYKKSIACISILNHLYGCIICEHVFGNNITLEIDNQILNELKEELTIRPDQNGGQVRSKKMIITREETLTNFDFWSGAKDNASMLTYEQLEEVTRQLEEIYPEGMTETQINDMFWFDFGYVCELIGLSYDEENDKILEE